MHNEFDNSSGTPTDAPDQLRHVEHRLRWGMFRDIVQMILILVIMFAAARTFFLPYQVDGASMAPSLVNGEHIFVNRTAYATVNLGKIVNILPGLTLPEDGEMYPFSEPQRGDIVVLQSDQTSKSSPYIKRIIGLPGETVTFYRGIVLVDGEPLVEDYIPGAVSSCRLWQYCDVRVPPGSVYVLGDNRTNSEDSRAFGAIPMDDIVGKAYFTNWPYEEIGPIQRPDYGEVEQ